MEAKALVDTLVVGIEEAEVKTLGKTLSKVESLIEAGQTKRAQASIVVEKVDKFGDTLA